LDLGSEHDEPPPFSLKGKKSKQRERPAKIVPTTSDHSSDDDDSDENGESGPVTMANMEARSRALDAEALAEAERDIEEQQAALEAEEVDFDGEAEDGDLFHLPTPQEREEEKKAGGPDVQLVQLRMRECVRVLGNFKKLAAKGR
jgi:ribosomal RNA methyltransferase Nop2